MLRMFLDVLHPHAPATATLGRVYEPVKLAVWTAQLAAVRIEVRPKVPPLPNSVHPGWKVASLPKWNH